MVLKSKRPLSVWIAQIILGIYGLGFALIILWGLYKGLTEGIRNPELFVMTNLGGLSLVVVSLGGLWGMAIRKPWGRWLGVAGLSVLLIGTAITQTSRRLADTGSSFVSIRFLLSVLVVVGMAFLVYKVAAGDAADAFFEGKSTEGRNRDPDS
ncbi:MAG TPA: hypothetical protein VFZ23_05475 [Pyrinomonadaceae bacterium]